MKKLIILFLFLFAVQANAAELLVMAKPHWSVEVGRAAEFPKRYRVGDIVSPARPNGWFKTPLNPGGKGWNREVFKLIRVPLTALQVRRLHKPLYDNTDPENPIMLARRKFNVRRILRLAKAQNRIGIVDSTDDLNLFEKTAGDIAPVLDPEA